MNQPSDIKKTLSPLALWALSFGCAVGWGSFMMPGNVFLPAAGPWGTVIGLVLGGAVMLVLAANYAAMMHRHPGEGGSYSCIKGILGLDHAFLCGWLLILTYVAVLWANAAALSMITRYLFGSVFQFGFSYSVAGYTVYFGEFLLSGTAIFTAMLLSFAGKKTVAFVQTVMAILLFTGIFTVFVITAAKGGLSNARPAFAEGRGKGIQIFSIVALAPWAFVGFECISHFSLKKEADGRKHLLVFLFAILAGVLAYAMLTLIAASALPEGFSSWTEYVSHLGEFDPVRDGIVGAPTFFAASSAAGGVGVAILGVAAFCGIFTGLLATFSATGRLMGAFAEDHLLPGIFARRAKNGSPRFALFTIAVVSVFVPALGRTAINWIVDVTTICAAIVYAYISIAAFLDGKRTGKKRVMAFGVVGAVLSVFFTVFYILPTGSAGQLSAESHLILVIWSILGVLVFRFLMRKDEKTRRFGNSAVVWIVLLFLILAVSLVWIRQVTDRSTETVSGEVQEIFQESLVEEGADPGGEIGLRAGKALSDEIAYLGSSTLGSVYLLIALLALALLLTFSIFSVIKNREKHLESERIQAEESSKAKSIFLSNMSHDIRTPMNAVLGYTALAMQEKDLPEKTREYLEKIDFSGKHLLSLINDILDMSRIESGKMELLPEEGDLVETFGHARDIFAAQMQQKHLRFTVDTSSVVHPWVLFDQNRLMRVLMNLISNAYKFTPQGGSVTVRLEEKGVEDGKAQFLCTVADTGIGMSEEFAERVFDAFERERSRTVNSIQGTGLGMAITKNLVELMEGDIRVKTKPGEGTSFFISLAFPVCEKKENGGEEEEQADFSGMHLLLAEDNPVNAEIAKMLLESAGFTLDHAENGLLAVEAVKAAEPGTYDAILMDVQMPVMNGYDASRAIRALPGEKSAVPIIAMTANVFAEDLKEAKDAGMNAHVAKPIEVPVLIQTLQSVLHHRS